MPPTRPAPPAIERARKWILHDRAENLHRDREIEKLAAAYDGHLFDLEGESRRLGEVSATLRDASARAKEGGEQDYRATELSINLTRPLIEDWKSVIGIIPTVGIPSRNPGVPDAQRNADLRERIVGATWTLSNMVSQFLEGAHSQLLFGAQVPYVLPDPDEKTVAIRVRTPYRCFARHKLDGLSLHYLGWQTQESSELLFDLYPGLSRVIKGEKAGGRTVYPPEFTLTEWMDQDCRFFMVEDEFTDELPYVEHNWGFVPGVVVPNIVGTGSIWSRSEASQVVHIAQVLSEVISMSHDSLFQQVYDQIVAFDDRPITQIGSGPYTITQLSKDAKIQLLHAGQNMPEVQSSLGALERYFRLMGGWPNVLSSELDSSVVTGKAFVAAQGPVSARAAIKHMVLAASYQRINSFALMLWEKVFPDRDLEIFRVDGAVPTSIFPNAGRQAAEFIRFRPRRDIAGQYENTLSFNASGTDQYRQVISWLQLKEAEVISTEYIQQNLTGIDAREEQSRVRREFMERAQREIDVKKMLMEAEQQAQTQSQMRLMQAQAQMQGGPPQGQPQGQPEGQPAMNPAEMAVPASAAGRMRAAMGPAAQAPPGGPARGPSDRVTLQQAKSEFARVKPIRGEVYLGGAIAMQGWTDGPVEVYLTEPNDWSAIISQTSLGARRRLVRHILRSGQMPDEPVVNVTPPRQEEAA